MSETNPPENSSQNPYVGPRPFEPHEQQLFFGRDWEAEELVALIVAHPAVLFYAQSGAGKSSLLNAEVVPKLQAEEGCEVLPVARVRGDIPAGIQAVQIQNLYAFNTLLNWTEAISEITPEQLIQRTLADFLSLLPHQSDKEGYPALRIIIFDQFEELFTFYPQRWPEREQFFVQVSQALAADSLLRVLFVIREDYLAQLDPYLPLLPEQLRYRFRLERLRREAALAAVIGPLQGTGRSFAPGVAEALVAELLKIRVESRAGEVTDAPGEFVEPVQLQVVCQSLWDGLPPDVTEITESQLLAFGNVDQALTRFYERAVRDTVEQLRQTSTVARWFPLYTSWQLRNWFEADLVTPAGTRGLVYRGAGTTGGVPNLAVDMLESRHIIRAEQRAGARWYELTHDRFIRPIQQSNTRWRTDKLKQIAITGGSLIGLAIALLILTASFFSQIAATAGADAVVTAAAAAQVEATATAVQAQATQMAESAAVQAAVAEATSTAAAQTIRKDRVRPLRPGLSIGLAGLESVGTLGTFVVDEDGRIYLLSTTNSFGRAASRVQVLQPAFFDGGQTPEDVVAGQVVALPQTTSMPAVRMVALAPLMPGLQIQTVIPEIGPIRGVREPEVSMAVRKVGRTTGLTEGTIRALDERISVSTLNGMVQLRDVIRASPMSATGDGGALVVDSEGYAVGVIVATSERGTFIASLAEVLDEFDVELLSPPVAESPYLYGLNDRGGEEKLLLDDKRQAKGWLLISEAIGADPANTSGSDYTDLAYQGFGVIVQLNYALGSAGTLPLPDQYPDFARRAANFVAHSAGANIWIVGYEMNSERYWPRLPSGLGDGITPRQYADCYKLVRDAIHALPGHENDQVVVGPIAPWNGQLSYDADPRGQYPANQAPGAPQDYPFYGFFGDWIVYLRDILLAIGAENMDGIALHAYTHGYDPVLVFSDAKMDPPFQNYHYHFRTYQDQMNIIPPEFRRLPVYLTETNGGNADGITWPDVNSGWVQNVYQEIDTWNKAGNQTIRAVLLYRWSNVDGWGIEGKSNVQQDFREAVAQDYRWRIR